MKKPYTSIRVFQSPQLEKLTHVHPLTPLVIWLPIVAFLFYHSFATLGLGVYAVGSLAVLGLIAWTATEYLLHRFIFHFTPRGSLQERLQFLLHGLHHEDPRDPTRLVMPPVISLALGVLFFLAFHALFSLMGVSQATFPFYAGFSIGYLCYDYIHYGIHHFTPRSRLGKWVKQHHMLHHFVTPDARWGVSSPLWDYVFGTVSPVKARPARGRAENEPAI